MPIPAFASFAELNAHLEQRCLERLDHRVRGHAESIGERLVRDLAALQARPPMPYEACERRPGRVSSLSLVRYERNDYSVPTAYGHRAVLVRGYVDEVVISCGAEIIARHKRSYAREDFSFDPLHYLALLEQKTGALDQAAALQGWNLPEAFATLRRLLEGRMGKAGKREYVQVLRLLETFRLEDVHAAVREALRLGAIGFDAVKHLVLCRIERRPPKLDLALGEALLYPGRHARDYQGRDQLRLVACHCRRELIIRIWYDPIGLDTGPAPGKRDISSIGPAVPAGRAAGLPSSSHSASAGHSRPQGCVPQRVV